jgi:hypothetical protein
MPVLLQRRARRPNTHRQDACATAKTGETPETPQAGCLCYCKDGRDARTPTGRMPVLLQRRARRPNTHRQDACATAKTGETPEHPQAGCLCYFFKFQDKLKFELQLISYLRFAASPLRRFADSPIHSLILPHSRTSSRVTSSPTDIPSS